MAINAFRFLQTDLKAQFRWNQKQPLVEKGSSIVSDLKEAEWVPQQDGQSISFVRPREALIEHLSEGFPYETGQKWLEVIEFGKTSKQQRLENIHKEVEQNRQNQKAKEFGFGSEDEAKKAAEYFKKQRGHHQ